MSDAELTAEIRAGRGKALRPKRAATLILLDTTGREPSVLMGRRHPKLVFLPDHFVFPGGRVERGDALMPASGALSPMLQRRLQGASGPPRLARSLVMAAIRETFEETGLLLGAPAPTPVAAGIPPGAWRDFATHGVQPTLDGFSFVARAITPPGRPRRFDTHFLMADASLIAKRLPDVVTPDTELVELAWMPLSRMAELKTLPITRRVLRELQTRLAAGNGSDLPVPFLRVRRGEWLVTEL